MAKKEYKKYRSNIETEGRFMRVTGDVKVINDTFVKIPTVATSENDADEEMWLDVVPIDSQAPMASYVEKGDLISFTGFPTYQLWGDDHDKVSHTIKFARLHFSPEFIAVLKERGYEPGSKSAKGSKGSGKRGAAKGKARDLVIPPDEE